MATYYYHGQNYPMITLTATPDDGYRSVGDFRADVQDWLKANDILFIYDGEFTDFVDNVTTFRFKFRCFREEHATLVGLKWA